MAVSRRVAVVCAAAVCVFVSACSSPPAVKPSGSPSSSGGPAPASSSPSVSPSGSPAASVSPVALSVAQSYMGFAAEVSRSRRGLAPDEPDPRLFSALRKSKADWVAAAESFAGEAALRSVSVLVEGVAPGRLTANDISVSDGIVVTVFNTAESCVVVASFIPTGNGDTAMSWAEPECSSAG